MSRFGSTATFYYSPGTTLTAGTYLYLGPQNMPNYPFQASEFTDRVTHTTKSGKTYSYSNYSNQMYTFNFSNLDETTRVLMKRMYDTKPIFTFNTNGLMWGTFKFSEDQWQDEEVAFELYDLSFSMVEQF